MRRIVLLVVAALVLGVEPGPGAPAAGAPGGHRTVTPCSRGLVALTFDDGPAPAVTPRLVRRLTRLGVPATFFMVGTRVAAAPGLVRKVSRAGFQIGNHTWAHTDLTTLGAPRIRHALRATRHALIEAGAPAPTLVRPPYGAIDDRVRRVVDAAGYTPVLWTIDSRDWAGGTPRQIARRVIEAVRPHQPNVVLQHDGVTNSPATLRAIPREVEVLRKRGYCFAGLGPDGRPTPPVPVAGVSVDRARVAEGDRVRVTVRLDRPTNRATTALIAAGGSATSGADFRQARWRVGFAAGEQVARLWLRTRTDGLDEPAEEVTFKVFGGHGVQPALVSQGLVQIADVDPPPTARPIDAAVRTSALLPTTVRVGVRLDRASGRDVRLTLSAPGGPRSVTVPAGARGAGVSVTIPPGRPAQQVRRVPVRITAAHHAVAGVPATLVVRPPTRTRDEEVRAALASVRWPTFRLPALFGFSRPAAG